MKHLPRRPATASKILHVLACVLATFAAIVTLGAGVAHAAAPFIDNGDGTVTDYETSLMWDQCSAGSSGNGCATGTPASYTWANAVMLAATQNSVNYKGYSDRRLPSIVELKTLVNLSTQSIDTTVFPNTPTWHAWSGSSSFLAPMNVWAVDFSTSIGTASQASKLGNYYVRLVRGGQSFDTFTLSVDVNGAGAGTVTASGLVCTRTFGVTTGTCARQVANTAYAGETAQSLTLTATPAAGSVFTGWGGACSGTVSTCTVTIDAAKGVSVEFIPISTSSIIIDSAIPTTLYSSLDGGGVYKKVGAGNWTAATTQPASLRVKALVIKPGDSSKLFAATYGGGVFQSSDSGLNWNIACAGQPTNLKLLSLTIDVGGKLYAGSEAGVFVSSDSCASWTAMSTGLP